MPLNRARIESAAHGHPLALRQTLIAISDEIDGINQHVGRITATKVDTVAQSINPPPSAAGFAITAQDGRVRVTLTNPQNRVAATQKLVQGGPSNIAGAAIYHELSSCESVAFDDASTLTVYPASTATTQEFTAPNTALYWRLRSSFDQNAWNGYQVFGGVVKPRALSSASSVPNLSLNQSNFATVDSVAAGATPIVRVYGTGGVGAAYTRSVGMQSPQRPGATLLNIPYGANKFVAYDTEQRIYQVKDQLPQTFSDPWEPVGFVSVVFSGAPTLPVLKPIFTSGFLVGIQRISDGNGLSTPPLGVVVSGVGHNAAFVLFITNGQVSGYQINNGGDGNYVNTDTISVSGGISAGVGGGGGVSGGNGGRFYSNRQNQGL